MHRQQLNSVDIFRNAKQETKKVERPNKWGEINKSKWGTDTDTEERKGNGEGENFHDDDSDAIFNYLGQWGIYEDKTVKDIVIFATQLT